MQNLLWYSCVDLGRLFGPKGYGFGNTLSTETKITAVGVSPIIPVSELQTATNEVIVPTISASHAQAIKNIKTFAGTDKCPTCTKQVYHAEQIVACGSKYHKQCYVCTECGKGLDSRNSADKDGVIFCKSCHGKKYGPKGYGHGILTVDGPA